MKRLKRWSSILVLASLVFTLTACGDSASSSKPAETKAHHIWRTIALSQLQRIPRDEVSKKLAHKYHRTQEVRYLE